MTTKDSHPPCETGVFAVLYASKDVKDQASGASDEATDEPTLAEVAKVELERKLSTVVRLAGAANLAVFR
ncbi:hypothetical protein DIPPA_34353 [Diplonema papillatum]|nr:hypothetical protein DIPPA_34353 [Diplonema papillatum]